MDKSNDERAEGRFSLAEYELWRVAMLADLQKGDLLQIRLVQWPIPSEDSRFGVVCEVQTRGYYDWAGTPRKLVCRAKSRTGEIRSEELALPRVERFSGPLVVEPIINHHAWERLMRI